MPPRRVSRESNNKRQDDQRRPSSERSNQQQTGRDADQADPQPHIPRSPLNRKADFHDKEAQGQQSKTAAQYGADHNACPVRISTLKGWSGPDVCTLAINTT